MKTRQNCGGEEQTGLLGFGSVVPARSLVQSSIFLARLLGLHFPIYFNARRTCRPSYHIILVRVRCHKLGLKLFACLASFHPHQYSTLPSYVGLSVRRCEDCRKMFCFQPLSVDGQRPYSIVAALWPSPASGLIGLLSRRGRKGGQK